MIHTSDWHLGAALMGQRRYDEQEKFLSWFSALLEAERPEILIIAGDIFDSSTPPGRAQKLYYSFLGKAVSLCRHIVIIGGNHDSPSFLNAPHTLLSAMNIHVVGEATENIEDEVLLLDDLAVICAVPFLRDRDVRKSTPGESFQEKTKNLQRGLYAHYATACALAEVKRGEFDIPLIMTGHLALSGGSMGENDGVRSLYIGSLAGVEAEYFPPADYYALGHLHVPQAVGHDSRRYSGSPLQMGFSEKAHVGMVLKVEFEGKKTEVTEIKVPNFKSLLRVKGTLSEITEAMGRAAAGAFVEVEYTGEEEIPGLREFVEDAARSCGVEVLRIKNNRAASSGSGTAAVDIESLDEIKMFEYFLEHMQVPSEEHMGLMESYREVLQALSEEDRNL